MNPQLELEREFDALRQHPDPVAAWGEYTPKDTWEFVLAFKKEIERLREALRYLRGGEVAVKALEDAHHLLNEGDVFLATSTIRNAYQTLAKAAGA